MWPVEVDLKFLEPVGKELKMLGKVKRHDMLLLLCLNQMYLLVPMLFSISEDMLKLLFA